MIQGLLSDPVPKIYTTSVEVDGQWQHSLHHDLEIPEQLAVIVGDFMFNLRSSLDHIVSKNLPRRTNKTPFPIYTEDITTFVVGEPRWHKTARDNWKSLKAQLPPAVFAVVDLAQPFTLSPITGQLPARSAMSILNTAQNLDKHNELLPVNAGIDVELGEVVYPDGARFEIEGLPGGGIFRNHSHIVDTPAPAEVEISGTVKMTLIAGAEGNDSPLPEYFDDLSKEVKEVLLAIERNMP